LLLELVLKWRLVLLLPIPPLLLLLLLLQVLLQEDLSLLPELLLLTEEHLLALLLLLLLVQVLLSLQLVGKLARLPDELALVVVIPTLPVSVEHAGGVAADDSWDASPRKLGGACLLEVGGLSLWDPSGRSVFT
jgi:hypothetical protein